MRKSLQHFAFETDMVVTVYGERGRCTRVYWSDGTMEDFPVKMETVLKNLAGAYGKTPQAIRKHWRQVQSLCGEPLLGRMMPLSISPALVLMPVRVAMETVGRDSATGYVNLAHAPMFQEILEENGARCRIVFSEHAHVLDTSWRLGTLQQHRRIAWMFCQSEWERCRQELRMRSAECIAVGWYQN